MPSVCKVTVGYAVKLSPGSSKVAFPGLLV